MSEEYAYKVSQGQWTTGFGARQLAIDAGLADGRSQVTTAKVAPECPSYFARFEAKTILARMISGLQYGEANDKLIGSKPAIAFLAEVQKAGINFLEADTLEFKLELDLMARLQAAVRGWVVENNLDFEQPKHITYMSEELHVAGTGLNIQLL